MPNLSCNLAALIGAALLLVSAPTQAQLLRTHDMPGGGCSDRGNFCAGLTAEISALIGIGAKDGRLTGGITPGVGYGACAMADTWHSICLSAHLNAQFNEGAPATALATTLFTFFNAVQVGPAYRVIGGTPGQVVILIGIGYRIAAPLAPPPAPSAVADPARGLPSS